MEIISTPIDAIEEIINKRTINSKTFQLENGKRRLVSKLGPVHYKDKEDNDRLKDIDTTVKVENGDILLKSAPYDFVLHKEGIGFDYTSKEGGRATVILSEIGVNVFNANPTPIIEGNKIIFQEVEKDLDIIIQLNRAGVQTFRILKSEKASRKFKWSIEHDEIKNFKISDELKGIDNKDNILRNEIKQQREIQLVHSKLNETVQDGKVFYEAYEEWTGKTKFIDRNTHIPEFKDDSIYPIVIDPDITEDIAANAEDGDEAVAFSSWRTNGIYIGRYSGRNYNPGWRFTSVAVPAGATIDLANLKVNVTGKGTAYGGANLYGDDVDNPAAWSSSARPSGRTKTSASAVWTRPTTTGIKTTDVTSIVAEIIARPGWNSGQDIALFGITYESGTTRNTYAEDFNAAGTNEAQLEIDYTETGGGGYPDTLYNVVLSKTKWKYPSTFSAVRSPLGYYRLGQSAPRTRLLERYPDKKIKYDTIKYLRGPDLSVVLSLIYNIEYLGEFSAGSTTNLELLRELGVNISLPLEYGPPDRLMDLILPRTLWKYSSSINVSPIGYWRPGQAYSRTQTYQRYPDKSRRYIPIKVSVPSPRDFTIPFDGSLSVALIYNIEYLQSLIRESTSNIETLINSDKTLIENLEYLLTVNRGDISNIEYIMSLNSEKYINTEWCSGVNINTNYFNLEYLQSLVQTNSTNIEYLSSLSKGESINIENLVSLIQNNPINLEYSVLVGNSSILNIECILSINNSNNINVEYKYELSGGKTVNIENLIDLSKTSTINIEDLIGLINSRIFNLEFLTGLNSISSSNIESLLSNSKTTTTNLENLLIASGAKTANIEYLQSINASQSVNLECLLQLAQNNIINIEWTSEGGFVVAPQQMPIEYLLKNLTANTINQESLINVSSDYPTSQTFNVTNTWKCPAHVTSVLVECIGGGGAGQENGGTGGGGGGFASSTISVVPFTTYNITVGDFGDRFGITSGGDSYFGDGSVVLAGGGGGGDVGGSGGSGTGTLTHTGGSGGSGAFNHGGGGGSSASKYGNGTNGNNATFGSGGTGGVAPSEGGNGGDGGTSDDGTNGLTPGGGGGGGDNPGVGGYGAQGRVTLTYNLSNLSQSTEYLLQAQTNRNINIENLINLNKTTNINVEDLLSLINSNILNIENQLDGTFVVAAQQIPIEYIIKIAADKQTNLEHNISLSISKAFNNENLLSFGVSSLTLVEYILTNRSDSVINDEYLARISVNGVLNLESLASLGVSLSTLNEWKSSLGLDEIVNIEFGGVTSLSVDSIVNIEWRLEANALQKLLRWIATERKTLWIANPNGTGWTAISRGTDWTSIER